MGSDLAWIATMLAALGSGLVGGVFLAFSGFVMKALDGLPAAHAIAAMQAINRVVINPVFLGLFLGTGLLCLGLMATALLGTGAVGAAWTLAGSLLYLAGSILVTMLGNVPLNDRLARSDAGDAASAAHWAGYLRPWLRLNHLRTVASALAAAAFMLAL